MALSSQVGSLQVREEELSSMLKLKVRLYSYSVVSSSHADFFHLGQTLDFILIYLQEKDMTEASSQIVYLTGRLRDLETSLSERQSQEKKFLKDLEENKRRYRDVKRENLQLHGNIMVHKSVYLCIYCSMQLGEITF